MEMDSTIAGTEEGYPSPYIVHPTAPHTHTIILLHGTSTSGPEFGSPFLSFPFPHPNSDTLNQTTTLLALLLGVRWIFPSGKKRKVTVLGGRETNAWFDIHDFSDRTKGEEDQISGLRDSVVYLAGLIKEEAEILKGTWGEEGGKRLVFGGFSQGCAMGVMLLLSGELLKFGVDCAVQIGGFVGMSGWLPFRRQISDVLEAPLPDSTLAGLETPVISKAVIEYTRDLLGLEPIALAGRENDEKGYLEYEVWLGHGEEDQKVLMQWGEEMRDVLGGVRCSIMMEGYEVGHWWCEAEMEGLVEWLRGLWGEEFLLKQNSA
jgi:predicted esterase